MNKNIFVKLSIDATIILSKSIVLNLEFAKSLCPTVVGCYRPQLATKEAMQSQKESFDQNYCELVLAGDLNWLETGST